MKWFSLTALALSLSVPIAAHADWAKTEAEAKGQTVYFNAWGGGEAINAYIAWVAQQVKGRYGVELRHALAGGNRLADDGARFGVGARLARRDDERDVRRLRVRPGVRLGEALQVGYDRFGRGCRPQMKEVVLFDEVDGPGRRQSRREESHQKYRRTVHADPLRWRSARNTASPDGRV